MTVYQFFETHRLAFLVRLWSLAPEAIRGYPLRLTMSGNTAREYVTTSALFSRGCGFAVPLKFVDFAALILKV